VVGLQLLALGLLGDLQVWHHKTPEARAPYSIAEISVTRAHLADPESNLKQAPSGTSLG
jgi:hypothetical protein